MFVDKFEPNRYYRRHPSWMPRRILFKDSGNDSGGSGGGSNGGSKSNAGSSGTGADNSQEGTPPDGGSSDTDGQSSDEDEDDEDEDAELTPAQQRRVDKAFQKRLARQKRKDDADAERKRIADEQQRLKDEKKWDELIKSQSDTIAALQVKADAYDKIVAVQGDELDREIARWPKSVRGVFTDDMPYEQKIELAQRMRPIAQQLATGQQSQQQRNEQSGDDTDDTDDDDRTNDATSKQWQPGQRITGYTGGANRKDPPAAGKAGASADDAAAKREHARLYRGF